MNVSEGFRSLSADIIIQQRLGNILGILLAFLGLFSSIGQTAVALFWKPLRDKKQTLVINVALGDSSKSISYLILACHRVYLAAYHLDEVTTQRNCMYWLMAGCFVILHGISSVFALSLERSFAISAPLWYRNRKLILQQILVGLSVGMAILGTAASFIGVDERPQLVCTVVSSTTPRFYRFLVWYHNIVLCLIFLASTETAAILIKRCLDARRINANKKIFNRKIELQILKSVFSVVGLCLVSFSGATVIANLTQNADAATRAFYGPIAACFLLLRGVFDFSIYIIFISDYRKGFLAIFCGRIGRESTEKNRRNSVTINMSSLTRLIKSRSQDI